MAGSVNSRFTCTNAGLFLSIVAGQKGSGCEGIGWKAPHASLSGSLPTYMHDGLDAKDVGGLGQRGDVVQQVKHAGHDHGVGRILDEKGNHERNDFTGPGNNMNCDEDLAIPQKHKLAG